MVHSKIIYECSSLGLATITSFLAQLALNFPHHLAVLVNSDIRLPLMLISGSL